MIGESMPVAPINTTIGHGANEDSAPFFDWAAVGIGGAVLFGPFPTLVIIIASLPLISNVYPKPYMPSK